MWITSINKIRITIIIFLDAVLNITTPVKLVAFLKSNIIVSIAWNVSVANYYATAFNDLIVLIA